MKANFYKYQATGNDFVLLDNRDGKFDNISKEKVALLCHRRFGIGADGLMLLNKSGGYDFEMKYFNSDGAPGSMCGNGARCIVQFAHQMGIEKDDYYFLAFDGKHEARRNGDEVSLLMNDVLKIEKHENNFVLNTGSPHYVTFVNEVEDFDVFNKGRSIRNSDAFRENGINVNFVTRIGGDKIFVRTYERGVEDETYSCGTGVTAAALVCGVDEKGDRKIDISTLGGKLSVSYHNRDNSFSDVWLTGPAVCVFSGEINL